MHIREPFKLIPFAMAVILSLLLTGCGGSEEETAQSPASESPQPPATTGEAEDTAAEVAQSDTAGEPADTSSTETASAIPPEETSTDPGEDTEAGDEAEIIEPEELDKVGTIELKQDTVAWVGSGTMGGGTLTVDGKNYPFKIAGLGVGGFGASTIDATGVVYDMPNLDAFPGTYGNARLGMTAGDSGGGKLWLKSTTGVVIELESEMRGLALAGGVDGIIIEWDEAEESSFDRARDSTEETVGEGIEYGADAVQKGVDGVKGWFKKDE